MKIHRCKKFKSKERTKCYRTSENEKNCLGHCNFSFSVFHAFVSLRFPLRVCSLFFFTSGIRVSRLFTARALGDGRSDCLRRRGKSACLLGVVLHLQVQPEQHGLRGLAPVGRIRRRVRPAPLSGPRVGGALVMMILFLIKLLWMVM